MKLAGPCSWLDHEAGWTMKLAGDLVGVKPLPSFTAAWWEETKRTVRLERVLTAAEMVVGFTDRLTHLGAASALLPVAGTALSVVRQRQAAGDPVERGDPVIRDWATVLGLLTDAGAVVYDDDAQRLLIGPVVSPAPWTTSCQCGGCRRATLRVPRKVREMPASALLTSVVRVQQAVVACAGPLSYKASSILRAARVPAEACYRSAVSYVLRTWLGNPAVVTVEECNSGGAKRVHLRVDTGPRKIIIDIVCHHPAGSPDTGQSVAGHLVRVVEDYAPAHPGFEPWLVNFVTQEEEAVVGPPSGPAWRTLPSRRATACTWWRTGTWCCVSLSGPQAPSRWLPRMSPM